VDTVAIREFIYRLAARDDTTTAPGGGISVAALIDSLNALFTGTSGRLLHYSNLQPGAADDMFLVTSAGAADWQATPNFPRSVAQVFYTTSLNPQSTGDTTSSKHVCSISQLDREYPLAQGSTYANMRVAVHVRGGDAVNGYVYNVFASTVTAVGAGLANLTQGDKLLVRFFPATGVLSNKMLKIYRVPSGYSIGSGANQIYGQEIANVSIPASNFPVTGNVNVVVTLSYAVK